MIVFKWTVRNNTRLINNWAMRLYRVNMSILANRFRFSYNIHNQYELEIILSRNMFYRGRQYRIQLSLFINKVINNIANIFGYITNKLSGR